MEYTVNEAKEHFSELIERALAGDEVLIATGEEHPGFVKLTPFKARTPIHLGWFKGQIPDVGLDSPFFDPLPEDELRLWNGEGETFPGEAVPDWKAIYATLDRAEFPEDFLADRAQGEQGVREEL